jgi:hypothetical protein
MLSWLAIAATLVATDATNDVVLTCSYVADYEIKDDPPQNVKETYSLHFDGREKVQIEGTGVCSSMTGTATSLSVRFRCASGRLSDDFTIDRRNGDLTVEYYYSGYRLTFHGHCDAATKPLF